MNKPQRICIISIIVYICTAWTVFAAENEFQSAQLLADLKTRLNLSQEQIAQVRPIMQEQSQTLRELIEKYKVQGFVGMRSLTNELEQLREETSKQLEPILSAEQMQELTAFHEEIQAQFHEKLRDRIISGVMQQLDVSREQADQMLPILRENLQKRRELIEKYQGQGPAGFRSFRKENQELQQQLEQQLGSILTVEQFQKYHELQQRVQERIRAEFSKRQQ